jgi:hypothetical protein
MHLRNKKYLLKNSFFDLPFSAVFHIIFNIKFIYFDFSLINSLVWLCLLCYWMFRNEQRGGGVGEQEKDKSLAFIGFYLSFF